MTIIYVTLLIKPSIKKKGRPIYVKIDYIQNDRYLYLTLKYFELANYKIIIYESLGKFIKLGFYGRLILTLKNLQVVCKFRVPKDAVILTFDPFAKIISEKQVIKINYDYFNNHTVRTSICIPYFMHPLSYKYYHQLPQLRNNEKTIPLLCYGSSKIPYELSIKNIFNCIPREDVCNFLIKNHEELNIELIENLSSLEQYKNQKCNRILFIDESKFRIPSELWLYYLSISNFFLALPGYMVPLSHNIIEAISVGTIPLTQYNAYINPKLINNHTCLEYNSLDKLGSIISNFPKIESLQIINMRENVLDYYEKNISPENVLSRLNNTNFKEEKIIINAEHQSIHSMESFHN